MCGGKIVAPSPEPRQEVKKRSILKSIWDYLCKWIPAFARITEINDSAIDRDRVNYSVVSSNLPKVNMCLKCGDLEIDDNWLRIPHPSKARISEAIKSGAITINGRLTVCHFCRAVEEAEKKHREYIKGSSDFQLDFVHPTSTTSL